MLVKDKKALTDILSRINEGIKFLEKDEIIICLKNKNEYPDSYRNKNGEVVNEMTKFHGSNLNQLKNAASLLHDLLNC